MKMRRREVFLLVKAGLVLEVDVQRGRERCRLELDSLARVERTEAMWTREETQQMLPAVELQFDYISTEKRRRCYVLLDDDPHEALQVLTEALSHVVEENQRRCSELLLRSVRLQCLRCHSEFMRRHGDSSGGEEKEAESEMDTVWGKRRRRRRKAAMMHDEAATDDGEDELRGSDNDEGNADVCPECGSDHVVQLAAQSTPCCSTPIRQPSRPHSDDDQLDVTQSNEEDDTDASLSSGPVPEITAATTTSTQDPTFITAQSSSFFISDDTSGLYYNTDPQSKEDLAGSYHYTATGATPPEVQSQPAGRSAQNDELDLLSEDFDTVDHRLQLFLDVEVFEDTEEELHSFLKMSAVKFGESGEVPSLLVVSNQRMYFLEMTSDAHRGQQLSDWLAKRDSRPILELGYLEVGLASQSIHMEFGGDGGAAYTLLVRDDVRCKRFFGLLTGIVREMAHKSDSELKSISTTRLNPEHHLWPLVCDDIQADVEDGQLQFFYILAFVLQDDVWTPLTVLATRETLYLLQEDHQWRRSSSGSVVVMETLPISCVSSLEVWPSAQQRIDIRLYDETLKQERTWCVRSDSGELLQNLLVWVRTQWEAMFGVKLHTSLRDNA